MGQTSAVPVTAYLSDEWIASNAAEVARNSDQLWFAGGGMTIGLTNVVTDVTPDPEHVVYHVSAGDGAVRFGPGPAHPEHVRMQQSRATAVAVVTGALSAQEAFIGGDVVVRGDQQRLLDARPLFVALDRVLAPVREQTTYT